MWYAPQEGRPGWNIGTLKSAEVDTKGDKNIFDGGWALPKAGSGAHGYDTSPVRPANNEPEGGCKDNLTWQDPIARSTSTGEKGKSVEAPIGCNQWIATGHSCGTEWDGFSSPEVVKKECPRTCEVCNPANGTELRQCSDTSFICHVTIKWACDSALESAIPGKMALLCLIILVVLRVFVWDKALACAAGVEEEEVDEEHRGRDEVGQDVEGGGAGSETRGDLAQRHANNTQWLDDIGIVESMHQGTHSWKVDLPAVTLAGVHTVGSDSGLNIDPDGGVLEGRGDLEEGRMAGVDVSAREQGEKEERERGVMEVTGELEEYILEAQKEGPSETGGLSLSPPPSSSLSSSPHTQIRFSSLSLLPETPRLSPSLQQPLPEANPGICRIPSLSLLSLLY